MPADPTRGQSAASRANGARSRGPLTDAGKARSRSNALKHGLRSAEFGLLPEENADAWEAHLAGVRATYLPQDPVEVHLVEGIAVARAARRSGRGPRDLRNPSCLQRP